MGRYRKRPVVVEARQFEVDNGLVGAAELMDWICEGGTYAKLRNIDMDNGGIVITTIEGEMVARPSDWIIKGVAGEFYPCKPEIFAATYDAVEAIDESAQYCDGLGLCLKKTGGS